MPLILTPFRFADFRLWSGTNLVSVTGTWMQVLAASWLLLVATGSAVHMGLGMLAQAVPVLLLGPWAGTLADRLPTRQLLTITYSLQTAISIMLALIVWSGTDPAPWAYGSMLAGGAVTAVAGPALGRFGSTTVDRTHLGPALAVGSVTGSAGRIVGMSIGGMLVAAAGAGPLFLINAATFLAAAGLLYRLPPAVPRSTDAPDLAQAPDPADAVPTTALAGLRYLLRDPMVAITLSLAFLLGSLARNYQVVMAAMSAGPLHSGPDGYSLLSTMLAVGALGGGLLAARAGRMYGRHLVVVGGVMSALEALSGLAPGLWQFATMLLPIAAAAVVVDTVVATRLQLDKPLAVRGRVLAAVGATGAVSGAVGAPVLGWLASTLGPRSALELAGVITALGCVAAAVAYASVQRRRATPAATPVPRAA